MKRTKSTGPSGERRLNKVRRRKCADGNQTRECVLLQIVLCLLQTNPVRDEPDKPRVSRSQKPEVEEEIPWGLYPAIIRPKEGDVKLRSSMGYPCGQNSLENTARSDCALTPEWGSRFVGAQKARAVGG